MVSCLPPILLHRGLYVSEQVIVHVNLNNGGQQGFHVAHSLHIVHSSSGDCSTHCRRSGAAPARNKSHADTPGGAGKGPSKWKAQSDQLRLAMQASRPQKVSKVFIFSPTVKPGMLTSDVLRLMWQTHVTHGTCYCSRHT